jgi:hypothetical protein
MIDGVARKKASMQQVDDNASLAWKREADKAALRAARVCEYLTSDDVVKLIPPSARTHEWRAMGPVMQRAARAGMIVKADMPGRNSNRPALHASPRTVWKSLVYRLI